MGSPRNPGGLVVSDLNDPVGSRNNKTQVFGTGASEPKITKHEAHDGYRQVKATKRGGTDDEESERPIVPMKPGNLSQRDPVEGRGRRNLINRWSDR